MTERRRFIATAGGVVAAAATAAFVDAPNVIAQPKVQWRMSTAYPALLDQLQGAAQRLAKVVEEMSGGRFRIEVFPGGQIIQPFECFEAASQGKIEAYLGTSQWWRDKEPAIEWFATIPFGMNPEGMAAWYYQGDGPQTAGGSVRPAQPRRAPCIFKRPADGRVVPEEDRRDQRLQGAQDAHSEPRRQGLHAGRAPRRC